MLFKDVKLLMMTSNILKKLIYLWMNKFNEY